MRIGIITFHNALNAGAVLQAYALQTFLLELGHQVEFINYCPVRKYNFRSYIAKSPITILNKWRNIYNWKKYNSKGNYNSILNLSQHKYLSYEDLKNDNMDYDVYIAGSDQIWNFHTSISPIYMLEFVPDNKKKIAYAASMGQCSLNKDLFNVFKNKLRKFYAISIREKNGVDFIKSLLEERKDIIQTLDPTLLIDNSYYKGIMQKGKFNVGAYICSYILSELDREDINIISYVSRSLKLKIINLRNPDSCINLRKANNTIVTPQQWLYYINNSSFIICSSFHAVVFSLIFHIPFLVLVPSDFKNKGGNMRINTLLEEIGLNNRIIIKYDSLLIDQIIKNSIDWDEIDCKIKRLRKTSIEFLKTNL